jgi:hypothetical protein
MSVLRNLAARWKRASAAGAGRSAVRAVGWPWSLEVAPKLLK